MKTVKTKDLVIAREYYFDLLEEQKGVFEGKDNFSILFTPTYDGKRTYGEIKGKVTFNREYETEWIEVSPEEKAPAQEISDCEKEKLKEERAILFAACDTAKNDIQMLLDGECKYNEENLKATINMLDKAMKLTLKV